MSRPLHRGLTPARLRAGLGVLFLALAVPSAVLLWQAQRQLRWEAFHQFRAQAEELAQGVDRQLQQALDAEAARGHADYQFLVVGAPDYAQRSPLAQYPVDAAIPGLIGYFQVDAAGGFSTPLLPAQPQERARLGAAELAQRTALRDRLLDVLSSNELVQRRERASVPLPAAADAPAAASYGFSSTTAPAPGEADADRADERQAAAFDQLNAPAPAAEARSNTLGRVQDLKLDDRAYQQAEVERQQSAAVSKDDSPLRQQAKAGRALRKEQVLVLESAVTAAREERRVRIFESEVGPLDFARLDSGQFVLFRSVWRDGQRSIQGALIEAAPFLERALAQPFRDSPLVQMSNQVVAFQDAVLTMVPGQPQATASAGDLRGALLHQVRLSAPLDDLQLLWTINALPAGPGARVVAWSGVVLLLVLIGGFVALERLGMRQLRLARAQQDFVSAVSHELKTPLTSIRMYGEMLREGWVSEDKKREYYSFIHDESERLSRLIANVLQLARLERNDLNLKVRRATVQSLADLVRSKVASQVGRAGFALALEVDPACAGREVSVDPDAFAQIVINLVDNALKFAAGAARKRVDVSVRCSEAGRVAWRVRDYGPGIPRAQRRKIFRLFYRPGSELTRTTTGTGIGLALARQLAQAMGGDLRLTDGEPGAEFELTLPLA